MSKPTRRDQMVEAAQEMEDGMIRLQTHRDAWQNDLLWWMCKSIKLLLEAEIRRKDDDVRI